MSILNLVCCQELKKRKKKIRKNASPLGPLPYMQNCIVKVVDLLNFLSYIRSVDYHSFPKKEYDNQILCKFHCNSFLHALDCAVFQLSLFYGFAVTEYWYCSCNSLHLLLLFFLFTFVSLLSNFST